jgi:hypothetical protein
MLSATGAKRHASTPRVFVNFAARLDPAPDERRRRLEKAHGLSAPGLLEVFADFEKRVSRLSDAETGCVFRPRRIHIATRRVTYVVKFNSRYPAKVRLRVASTPPF